MNDNNFDRDYLSVKEFSEIVGITAETLRHYDRQGIFQPAKIGADMENNYRYYSPTQITTIKMVRVLTDIEVPLETIKELAQDRTPETLMKLFAKHKSKAADGLRFLQEVHSIIGTFLELLTEGISATENEISVSELPEKRIILGEPNNFHGASSFYREYIHFCNTQHKPKLNLSYPVGGFFESMDVFLDVPSQPTRFFSLDPKGSDKRESGLYMTGYTRGYYGQTNDLPKRMAAFAKKNGLIFNGPVYNLYLFDEMSITDPDQYLLQVIASVRETRRIQSRSPKYR